MSAVTSRLTKAQERMICAMFGHVRLSLLYKASIHGYLHNNFLHKCTRQGPTLTVAYNNSGFIFGGYISKDYAQTGQRIIDEKAFLFSFDEKENPNAYRIPSQPGQYSYTDGSTGPHFGSLVFLHNSEATIKSDPGNSFDFDPIKMHGNDTRLIECEVYRVEEISALMPKPWRNLEWNAERRKMFMDSIMKWSPAMNSVSQARLLLVGPVGAGKSSFFNSVCSVFKGHVKIQANTGTAGTSLTTQFNPSMPMQETTPGFRKSVAEKDKIHCVVYVIDASKVKLLPDQMIEKFAAFRRKANILAIPQVALMTKVDEACPLVADDLKNVYCSKNLEGMMREVAVQLGLSMAAVIPVKNYSQEFELDPVTDLLLLNAVNQMLRMAECYFDDLSEGEEKTD